MSEWAESLMADNAGFIGGIISALFVLLVVGLILGGAYFMYLAISATLIPSEAGTDAAAVGLSRLMLNSVGGSYAMIAAALWIGALVLILFRGFEEVYRRLEDQRSQRTQQIKLLEQQGVFLRFLAEQAKRQA